MRKRVPVKFQPFIAASVSLGADMEQTTVLRAVGEKQAALISTGDLDSSETVANLTEITEGIRGKSGGHNT